MSAATATAVDGGAREQRWQELLAQEAAVLAVLRRFRDLSDDERTNTFYDVAARTIARWEKTGKWPSDVAAYLVIAATNKVLDEDKSVIRRGTHAMGLAGTDYHAGSAPGAAEELEARLAREEVAGLCALLSPTQSKIAVLRWRLELEPREIADALELSRKTVYSQLDAITDRLHAPARELVAGGFPTGWSKLVCGYVAGTLSARDQAKATQLLRSSTDAQLLASQLRRSGEQLAGLIAPSVFYERSDPGGLLAAIGDAITAPAGWAKHQIASVLGRTTETAPALAASPRSGVGAILASCVIAGGGTVCAISGTTPGDLADIFGSDKKPKVVQKQPPRKARKAPVTASAQPTPRPAPRPARRAAGPRSATASQPPPPAATQAAPSPAPAGVSGEFGPQPEAPAPGPAPAPIDGPGEFGP